METKIINGHRVIVDHIFPGKELKVGTSWMPSDGDKVIVTIDEIKIYPASDHEEDHWYEIYYSGELDGEKYADHRDHFNFQVKYCMICEETK
jgi:hypothetical protein